MKRAFLPLVVPALAAGPGAHPRRPHGLPTRRPRSIATSSAFRTSLRPRSKTRLLPPATPRRKTGSKNCSRTIAAPAGPWPRCSAPSFFESDLRQRVMRHAEVSQARYQRDQPEDARVIEAYQTGIKQFMQEHPEQVPSWAPPIEPWNVIALGRYIIWNWPMGEAAADLGRAGVEFGPLSYRGSNEMLIAPQAHRHERRHRDHRPARAVVRGDAVLRGANLHARVQRGRRVDSGRSTADPGPQPLLLGRDDHRRSRHVGHLRGRNQPGESQAVSLRRPVARFHRCARRRSTSRTADKVEPREVTLAFSHHGPIVARKNGKAYAMAIPYANEVGLTDQCYQMMTARNLAEMKQALSHRQLMAQNIMVATVQGDIYYLRNGRVPIRAAGVDPSRPIRGQYRRRPNGKGIHPIDDLVQIENPPCGWMQNCNCSPAAMMNRDQPRHEQFAERAHLYNESPSGDAHQRAEMVTDLLAAADKVTVEQAIEIAFSTQVWHAERWQARLEEAWQAASAADKAGDPQTVYTADPGMERPERARLERGARVLRVQEGAWAASWPDRPSRPRT